MWYILFVISDNIIFNISLKVTKWSNYKSTKFTLTFTGYKWAFVRENHLSSWFATISCSNQPAQPQRLATCRMIELLYEDSLHVAIILCREQKTKAWMLRPQRGGGGGHSHFSLYVAGAQHPPFTPPPKKKKKKKKKNQIFQTPQKYLRF